MATLATVRPQLRRRRCTIRPLRRLGSTDPERYACDLLAPYVHERDLLHAAPGVVPADDAFPDNWV